MHEVTNTLRGNWTIVAAAISFGSFALTFLLKTVLQEVKKRFVVEAYVEERDDAFYWLRVWLLQQSAI